jgi:hypothetical protein
MFAPGAPPVIEAEPSTAPGREVLDEHVGLRDDAADRRDRRGSLRSRARLSFERLVQTKWLARPRARVS